MTRGPKMRHSRNSRKHMRNVFRWIKWGRASKMWVCYKKISLWWKRNKKTLNQTCSRYLRVKWSKSPHPSKKNLKPSNSQSKYKKQSWSLQNLSIRLFVKTLAPGEISKCKSPLRKIPNQSPITLLTEKMNYLNFYNPKFHSSKKTLRALILI